MTRRASVEGDERVRLFCALLLPEPDLERIVAWQGEHLRGGRVVPPSNLHVTVAFLGPTPTREVERIVDEVRAAAHDAGPIELRVRGYRETRSVGMLTFDDAGGHAAALAADLHGRLAAAGVYEPEARAWLPHLTVLRFRERPRLSPGLPELGPVRPSDAALYHSVLRSTGAQYDVVESIALSQR